MRAGRTLAWTAVSVICAVPLGLSFTSPLLAWRDPVYIVAAAAGVAGLSLLFLQPLLMSGTIPRLDPRLPRRAHRLAGATLVALLVAHVAGLWITSPPDMVDALLFRSPTPFSAWGVIAMWAMIATALLAARRRRLRPCRWRLLHKALAVIIVGGSVAHAVLIEGTMEPISKVVLCALAVAATLGALRGPRPPGRQNATVIRAANGP